MPVKQSDTPVMMNDESKRCRLCIVIVGNAKQCIHKLYKYSNVCKPNIMESPLYLGDSASGLGLISGL